MKRNLLFSLTLAAAALTASAQEGIPSLTWANVINGGNGNTTPEAVASVGDNTFLLSKFVSKGSDDTKNFVDFGTEAKVAFGAPSGATSGNDNLLISKIGENGIAEWHVYSKQGRVGSASAAVTSDGGVVVAAVMSFTAFNSKDATDIPANSILQLVDAGGNVTNVEKTFNNASVFDLVVMKLSAAGSLEWYKQAVADEALNALTAKVAVDADGNIFIGGQHAKTLNFGSNAVAARAAKSLYLVKLDNAGNFVKNFDITGTDAEDYIDDIAAADGKVFVAGRIKAKAEGDKVKFGDIEIAPTTLDDAYAAAFDTDLNPVWATLAASVAASDGKHTTQIKGIDVSEGYVLVTGLVKGGYKDVNATTPIVYTSSTVLEGMVLGFNAEKGALEKGENMYEGISGFFSATIKNDKIYTFGYNVADAEEQGSSIVEFENGDNDEIIVAVTNEPATAGYPTTFTAKFNGNKVIAGVRAKGAGINILENNLDFASKTNFTATALCIDLSEIFSSVSNTVAESALKVVAVEGGVKVSAAEASTVSVYNIAGQIVAKQTVAGETIIALPAGFYIVGNSKVVVK